MRRTRGGRLTTKSTSLCQFPGSNFLERGLARERVKGGIRRTILSYRAPVRGRRAPGQRTKQQFLLVDIKLAGEEPRVILLVCWLCSQGWEGVMRRTITRLTIVGIALCLIVLISFPSFPSTLGMVSKPILVDRTVKGDRLSNTSAPTKHGPKAQPSLVRAEKRVPVGCDHAFSSMSSPDFSTIFGRLPGVTAAVLERSGLAR